MKDKHIKELVKILFRDTYKGIKIEEINKEYNPAIVVDFDKNKYGVGHLRIDSEYNIDLFDYNNSRMLTWNQVACFKYLIKEGYINL